MSFLGPQILGLGVVGLELELVLGLGLELKLMLGLEHGVGQGGWLTGFPLQLIFVPGSLSAPVTFPVVVGAQTP